MKTEFEKLDQLTAEIFERVATFETAAEEGAGVFAKALSHAAAAILCQERGEVDKVEDEWIIYESLLELLRCDRTNARIEALKWQLTNALRDAGIPE